MAYAFYQQNVNTPATLEDSGLDPRLSWEYWLPSGVRIFPSGLPYLSCLPAFVGIWGHYFRMRQAGARYGFLIIRDQGQIVHYTGIASRCGKYPFMDAKDQMIGPAWTHPAHRRKGLLKFSFETLLHQQAHPRCNVWWVCRLDNAPSNLAAQRLVYRYYGNGRRTHRFGLRYFGHYFLENELC